MTPKLCKAARVLLDWTQEDLAHHAGLSLTAIKDFEHEERKPRASTLRAIQSALEDNGIEFPATGGLRMSEDTSQLIRISGPDFIQKHNEMIYACLRTSGSEILTCSTDDSFWTSPLAKNANIEFKAWRKRLNIIGKTLMPTSNVSFNEPKHQYRALAPEIIGKITYVIYADRISFILWKERKALVIRNALIANTFRSQFNYLWRLGKSV